MTTELVIHDHDGGIDDYLSLGLLLTMENVKVLGVVVTPADCYATPAVSVTRKLLDLLGRNDIPVAESTVRGLNPFPREWRQTAYIVDHFPILNDADDIMTPLVPETGQQFLTRALLDAPEPVTLLVTGPLTTVAAALDSDPAVEGKIRRILWMGGALNVRGNVDPLTEPGHDGSAEWNVYWDPIAAYQVWQTNIPLVLCPLDITNHVPVTSAFIKQLGRNRQHKLSEVAALCYSLVMNQGGYYFWDVLTTGYLGRPDLYTVREETTAVLPDGLSQGRTVIDPHGRRTQVLESVDVTRFYDYILTQWRR
ncbi:MAG: nucleoside hydrolase [Anaerolineae bacterium]|nr:nucleoside hydrolase [Anaerolineae bacterium]